MANFKSGGAARGLQAGLAIREARKSREGAATETKAEKFRLADEASRNSAIENVTKFSELAAQAAKNAYAPYSGVTVGAALVTGEKVFTGANVENSSSGLTVCAERVALFAAVSQGRRQFTKLAVASNQPRPLQPCGACLQVLSEFCDDLEIILVDSEGRTSQTSLKELFPRPFRLEK